MIEHISTLEELNKIENPSDNYIVYLDETSSYKIYNEGEWKDYNIENPSFSLYELNKTMFSNARNMDWRKVEGIIKKWNKPGIYFMLYGKEIGYFTLFKKSENSTEKFHEVFKDCLSNIGDLKACDITEDKEAIEIWIKQKENNEMTCLYLFNYDMGVVEYNG